MQYYLSIPYCLFILNIFSQNTNYIVNLLIRNHIISQLQQEEGIVLKNNYFPVCIRLVSNNSEYSS
jgi:hypothetical protein